MFDLVSLQAVRKNRCVIKASIFDDQILIFIYFEDKMISVCKMFYNEEHAYLFIDNVTR